MSDTTPAPDEQPPEDRVPGESEIGDLVINDFEWVTVYRSGAGQLEIDTSINDFDTVAGLLDRACRYWDQTTDLFVGLDEDEFEDETEEEEEE